MDKMNSSFEGVLFYQKEKEKEKYIMREPYNIWEKTTCIRMKS